MRALAWLGLLFALFLVSTGASAAVRLQGNWPDADKPVSLDARKLPRDEAIRKIADAAGWSVVLQGVPSDEVDLHVTKQPASKVLGLLLSDRAYVASRDGALVSITLEPAAPPPVSTTSAQPPAPLASASAAPPGPASSKPEPDASPGDEAEAEEASEAKEPDRVISGGSVRVEKEEVVHDVVVFGGNADILGKATGDVTVIGGYAHIYPGAHVEGDATAIGGELTVDDGARVDGDVGVVGGVLHRGKEADVRGVEKAGKHGHVRVSLDTDKDEGWTLRGILHDIGAAITRTALLFVFGAIFLALAAERMQALQGEIAARPMKSLALGVVGLLVTAAVMIALCVTIIGIPFAVMAALLAAIVVYVGVCAALTVLGAALLRHRTTNPYIHLGVGCGLFLLVGWLPYLGTVATIAVGLVGFGSLLATRGAGLVPQRPRATG